MHIHCEQQVAFKVGLTSISPLKPISDDGRRLELCSLGMPSEAAHVLSVAGLLNQHLNGDTEEVLLCM